MRPLIMAHRGGDCFGTENSIETVKESLKRSPDIIEVDVRKSTDGIIFCYHGNLIEYMFPGYFFKKSFAELRQRYPSIAALKSIVKLVGYKSALFLDIKDKSITKSEIAGIFRNIRTKEIYFASQSLDFLKDIGKLPKGWKKVCNGGILRLKPNFSRVLDAGLDAIELFHWDYTDKNIRLLKNHNIESALAMWLLPAKTYMKKSFSKRSLWVSGYYFYRINSPMANSGKI